LCRLRVRVPRLPLWGHGPTGRRRLRKPEIRVRIPVTPLSKYSPVVQRPRHLAYTQETMVQLHPGLLTCPGTPIGRAAWLKPRRLPVRLRPWARPGRQSGRPPWLRTRDAAGPNPAWAIGNILSSWSSLECSPACHAGDRGFKSRRGRFREARRGTQIGKAAKLKPW
jgi:hypothetical protein